MASAGRSCSRRDALLGRTVELEMTLRTFDPYRLIEYTSVQQALPDVRHGRGFSAAGDGFEYRLAVEFEPRPGLRGAFDRGLVRPAVKRTCSARSRTSRAACSALGSGGAAPSGLAPNGAIKAGIDPPSLLVSAPSQ